MNKEIRTINRQINSLVNKIYSCVPGSRKMWKLQAKLTELRLKLWNLEEQFQSEKE